MKSFKKIFSILIFLFIFSFTIISPALAALPSGKTIADQMQGPLSGFDLPTSETSSPEAIIGQVIQAFLSVFGIIFLGLMIYGGYKWMTAQGREEEVKKAKDIIKAAVTGLIIVFAAYAISVFVIASVETATNQKGSAAATPYNLPDENGGVGL